MDRRSQITLQPGNYCYLWTVIKKYIYESREIAGWSRKYRNNVVFTHPWLFSMVSFHSSTFFKCNSYIDILSLCVCSCVSVSQMLQFHNLIQILQLKFFRTQRPPVDNSKL